MKCGEPRALWWNSCAHQEIGDAMLTCLGGFVGKCNCENGFGRNATQNKIGHAKSDCASFAGAGSGENEQWALGGFGGETLLWIKRVEKVLHECGRKRIVT